MVRMIAKKKTCKQKKEQQWLGKGLMLRIPFVMEYCSQVPQEMGLNCTRKWQRVNTPAEPLTIHGDKGCFAHTGSSDHAIGDAKLFRRTPTSNTKNYTWKYLLGEVLIQT